MLLQYETIAWFYHITNNSYLTPSYASHRFDENSIHENKESKTNETLSKCNIDITELDDQPQQLDSISDCNIVGKEDNMNQRVVINLSMQLVDSNSFRLIVLKFRTYDKLQKTQDELQKNLGNGVTVCIFKY